ncbi:hypothetical protein DV737_g4672, partial [Chaetothyriales sp. CBS 132003]
MAVAGEANSAGDLLAQLADRPLAVFEPTPALTKSAFALAKELLDPLATEISDAQKARRNENKKKRKRQEDGDEQPVLQLRKVHIEGVAVRQVWEQARRILDAACDEIERELQQDGARQVEGNGEGPDRPGELSADDMEEDIEAGEDEKGLSAEEEGHEPDTYVADPHGLNDGFFSIDDFNKQSQFLEQMDARGEDDNPSDEDEVDWDADPFEKDDDEEASDVDNVMPALNNTNDIRYAEFFEPPAKKLSKTKRMRALPKTQPPKATAGPGNSEIEDDLDADLRRAMDDVHRDIFASESEASSGEEEASDEADGPATRKNMSTHERQRAKIAAEIRRLEAANVAKRDWTLSGEARAVDRPVNSLIEEDLDFERVGKPVPVVTTETTEEIEALIKRRIIAREFDEVIRRRPDAIGSASDARRGRFEIDDRKAETGLADMYEQERLKSTDPNYVDKRSAVTKKQHAEIDKLWKDVNYQLDLLSNLHFKPKRVELEIKTVEDKPTISMEDARPVGEVGESMLAPQEVYKAGDQGRKEGEVMRKHGSSTVNKEEMSKDEKIRKRRREKERLKKQKRQNATSAGERAKKSKQEEKKDILEELKRGNVKVIDKKGDLQSLGKKSGSSSGPAPSSSALKL